MGKRYGGWEAYLLGQDLIFGPPLSKERDGSPANHQSHLRRSDKGGKRGGLDYDAPSRTPVVPLVDVQHGARSTDKLGGNMLGMVHVAGTDIFGIRYAHLYGYTDKTASYNPLTKLDIVGYVGSSGSLGNPTHLHVDVSNSRSKQVGIDPNTLGISGGKLTYYDGRTEIVIMTDRPQRLVETWDTLGPRLDDAFRTGDIDKITYDAMRSMIGKPNDMKAYLSQIVLGRGGRPEALPGSFMYSATLEVLNRTSTQPFIGMLPFIFPLIKETYQRTNTSLRI
jgi:hypothetical protein